MVLSLSANEVESFVYKFLATVQVGEDLSGLHPGGGNPAAVFKAVDVVQERGQIPLLKVDFGFSDNLLRFSFFGHISPFKFHKMEVYSGDSLESELQLASPGEFYNSGSAADMLARFSGDFDADALLKSIFLWRSCEGLSRICPDDLKKYFSKMKSVSRYEWYFEKYSVNNDVVSELWSTCTAELLKENKKIYVTFQNGKCVDCFLM